MNMPTPPENLSELECLLIEELILRRYCPECEVTQEEVRVHLEWLATTAPEPVGNAA